jgi:predicted nucleic-acid-binding protein
MRENLKILDTNIIIRFLIKDNPFQFHKVKELFENSVDNSLQIPDVVLCEVVFALESFYELGKDEIYDIMSSLISFRKFKTSKSIFQVALNKYSKFNISFLDAYLSAKSDREEKELITFDKKLIKATKRASNL